jgi:hypothetical protein
VKVGNRVQVVERDDKYSGMVGTIQVIGDNDDYNVLVALERDSDTDAFRRDEMKVAPAAVQMPSPEAESHARPKLSSSSASHSSTPQTRPEQEQSASGVPQISQVGPPPNAPEKSVAPKGRILRRVGVAVLITAVSVWTVWRFVSGAIYYLAERGFTIIDRGEIIGFDWPVIFVLVLGGALMVYRGKQWEAAGRSRAVDMLMSEAAPVVYLRPFAADVPGWRQVLRVVLYGVAHISSAAVMAATFRVVRPSEEEQLAEAVAPIGPLIGIGESGESLPKPGATRIYPAQWREGVEDLLRRARLVILRPGVSPGVRWEIERTFSTVDPEKVVLMFTRMKARRYENVRTAIAETCDVELPPFKDVRRGRKAHALITFGPSWTPKVAPLKAPYWRVSVTKPLLHVFRYALQPVYKQAGVAWQPSPLSKGKLIPIATLGLMIALVVVVQIGSLISPSGEEPQTTNLPTLAPQTQLIAGLEITVGGSPQRV